MSLLCSSPIVKLLFIQDVFTLLSQTVFIRAVQTIVLINNVISNFQHSYMSLQLKKL